MSPWDDWRSDRLADRFGRRRVLRSHRHAGPNSRPRDGANPQRRSTFPNSRSRVVRWSGAAFWTAARRRSRSAPDSTIASNVRQVLSAPGEELHDHDRVNGSDRNSVAHLRPVEPFLDDAQSVGQRNLIDVDPVEFDDGDTQGDEAAVMGFERFFTDQEGDVLRGARSAAVSVRAERTDQRVADACLEEHLRDLAHRSLERGHGPQRALELGCAGRLHLGPSVEGNLGSHNAGSASSVPPCSDRSTPCVSRSTMSLP